MVGFGVKGFRAKTWNVRGREGRGSNVYNRGAPYQMDPVDPKRRYPLSI